MPQTDFEYYDNENNYGGYQYFTFSEIIDEILLESQDDDSVLKNTKRSKIIDTAKRGIRELSKSIANAVQAFEITVPPKLWIPLPRDYVNWVRISVFLRDDTTNSFRLYPLDVNYNIHTALGYLQDNEYEILFDTDNEEILKSNGNNALVEPYKTYQFCSGYAPNENSAKYSKFGEFTIDKKRIVFSSELAEKDVVVEYVSDGLGEDLYDKEITIHKYLRQALRDYIIYECITAKRNISIPDKTYWRNKSLASRHRAVMAMSDFDLLRISRIMRVRTKNL